LRVQDLASILAPEDGAVNPAAWVERHARRRPGDPALADGDRVYASWGEFATRTAGAAASLREVEKALLRHPGVSAAAVVGRPDATWGEAVVAFVVAADRVAQPSVKDLDRTCLDHIARFKRPKDYRFVDALPANNYGKVVKRELRDRRRPSHEARSLPAELP
jgi:acyl-CoA synthetase (AMP-forming)/AMP-acid ligase II